MDESTTPTESGRCSPRSVPTPKKTVLFLGMDQVMSVPSRVEEEGTRQGDDPVLFDLNVFDKALLSDDEGLLALPAFKKRPLSDTPVVSSVLSPNINPQPSDESGLVSTEVLPMLYTTRPKGPVMKIPPLRLDSPGGHATSLTAVLEDGMPMHTSAPPAAAGGGTGTVLPTRHIPPSSTTLTIPGLTRSRKAPNGEITDVLQVLLKLVVVMVGLPARGKLYLTNKLARYLNWLQHETRVFNVGNTRRRAQPDIGPFAHPLTDLEKKKLSEHLAAKAEETAGKSPTQHDAAFFNPNNKESVAIREQWAMDTLDELLDYLVDGPGTVGIFDATNLTKVRRAKILARINERTGGRLKVMYLESVCNDHLIIENNMRMKLSGPDYKDTDPEVALRDFAGRLANYEKAYETIDEEEEKVPGFQYVKMVDVGKKLVAFNTSGFLALQTIFYLLNFNLTSRQVWVTRHGESTDNVAGRIGGDAPLTRRGHKFAAALQRFMNHERREFRKRQMEDFRKRLVWKGQQDEQPPDDPQFCVWLLMLRRLVETADKFQKYNDVLESGQIGAEEAVLPYHLKEMRMLNELGAGMMDGMTYLEIQQRYPAEFEERVHNKMGYRYPGVGGELYLDVINRLKPVISEIERTTLHLMLVTHRVVARVLLGYLLNLHKLVIGLLDVPLHLLYVLETRPYGNDYLYYEYDEQQDWFFKVDPDQKKKIKQVGVNHRERQYLVVPTIGRSGSAAVRPGPVAAGLSALLRQPAGRHPPGRLPMDQLPMDQLDEKLQKLKATR